MGSEGGSRRAALLPHIQCGLSDKGGHPSGLPVPRGYLCASGLDPFSCWTDPAAPEPANRAPGVGFRDEKPLRDAGHGERHREQPHPHLHLRPSPWLLFGPVVCSLGEEGRLGWAGPSLSWEGGPGGRTQSLGVGVQGQAPPPQESRLTPGDAEVTTVRPVQPRAHLPEERCLDFSDFGGGSWEWVACMRRNQPHNQAPLVLPEPVRLISPPELLLGMGTDQSL